MNKEKVLIYLIKKGNCCPLDYNEVSLKEELESGDFKDSYDILTSWLDCVLDESEIEELSKKISTLKEKDFSNIIKLVNDFLGHENRDGDFDGVAMELEEYFESYGDYENYGE